MVEEGMREVVLPLGEAAVRVPVGAGWQELTPTTEVAYLAREPDAPGFRTNVTVTVSDSGPPAEPDPGQALALALEGAMIDARPAGGGALVVVAHDAAGHEVVCVQRQLVVAGRAVAVTYTAAIDRLPEEAERLERWAGAVEAVEATAPAG